MNITTVNNPLYNQLDRVIYRNDSIEVTAGGIIVWAGLNWAYNNGGFNNWAAAYDDRGGYYDIGREAYPLIWGVYDALEAVYKAFDDEDLTPLWAEAEAAAAEYKKHLKNIRRLF